jgi:uncharacterized protein with PQ loop repeat
MRAPVRGSSVTGRQAAEPRGTSVDTTIPVLAGAVSTVIFASSTLPMLVKAARTKDLSSYSLGNILLANLGNLVHSIYVFQLPAGPIWALHTFHLVSTGLMLGWYLRYTESPILRRRLALGRSPDVTGSAGA